MKGLYVQKLRSWAYEAKFVCDVNAEAVAEASRRFQLDMMHDDNRRLLWVMDIDDATDFSRSVFEGIDYQAPTLASMGLSRIAVIIPSKPPFRELAIGWLDVNEEYMSAQRDRLAQFGVSIYIFPSRPKVIQWIDKKCPNIRPEL